MSYTFRPTHERLLARKQAASKQAKNLTVDTHLNQKEKLSEELRSKLFASAEEMSSSAPPTAKETTSWPKIPEGQAESLAKELRNKMNEAKIGPFSTGSWSSSSSGSTSSKLQSAPFFAGNQKIQSSFKSPILSTLYDYLREIVPFFDSESKKIDPQQYQQYLIANVTQHVIALEEYQRMAEENPELYAKIDELHKSLSKYVEEIETLKKQHLDDLSSIESSADLHQKLQDIQSLNEILEKMISKTNILLNEKDDLLNDEKVDNDTLKKLNAEILLEMQTLIDY